MSILQLTIRDLTLSPEPERFLSTDFESEGGTDPWQSECTSSRILHKTLYGNYVGSHLDTQEILITSSESFANVSKDTIRVIICDKIRRYYSSLSFNVILKR